MTDRELTALLAKDPERGMTEIIERYSGLLWSAAAKYLQNQEDLRDCVSEAFSEFYLHRENFDPDKGKLSGYLAVIARRRALRRLEDNRRQAGAFAEAGEDPFLQAEQRAELDEALARLEPADEKILRLKYYQGLNAKEIAAALNLPYETVKKRHQRGLKKLRKFLIAGMILALLALLAACVYAALRYFGIFPGYGVTTDKEERFYSLEEGASFSMANCEVHITDAWWRGGELTVQGRIYGDVKDREQVHRTAPEWSVEGLTGTAYTVAVWSDDNNRSSIRLLCGGGLPEDPGGRLELTLVCGETRSPFTLTAVQAVDAAEAGYYLYDPEQGGLLAVPRLENGELIVSVYPLNAGDFTIPATLCAGAFQSYGSPPQPITVTAPDGTVLEGTMENVSPDPRVYHSCLDWYFGPAEPGEYVLNVPYVYQLPAAQEEIPVDLSPARGTAVDIPGGRLEFSPLEPGEALVPAEYQPSTYFDGFLWWSTTCSWLPDDPERTLVQISLNQRESVRQDESSSGVHRGYYIHEEPVQYPIDEATGEACYLRSDRYRIGTSGGEETLVLTVCSAILRWDHPFTIPITVAPEPERPCYTQTEGSLGVTAVLTRSEEEGTVFSIWPLNGSGEDDLKVSPAICHNLAPVCNLPEEPVTLIAADGTVYLGSFQLGRSGDCSRWSFGDLPAGDYTLHIPYLYTELGTPNDSISMQGYCLDAPLPTGPGETVPAVTLDLGYGCSIRLGDLELLGAIEGNLPPEWEDVNLGTEVVGAPSGAVTYQGETPPNLVRVPIEACSGEEFTLAYVGVGCSSMRAESFESIGACIPTYDWEREFPLSGLLVTCHPEAEHITFSLWYPVFRWNHSFDIPVSLPETE